MFKNLIAPVQSWLLDHGQCVGCSMPLSKGKVTKAKIKGYDKVTCKCGRVFLRDQNTNKYRRALMSEI